MVLRGVMPRLGMPARKELMQRMVPAMARYLPTMAILTIVFGFILYLYLGSFDPALLWGILWGQLLLVALALALIASVIGLGIGLRSANLLLVHFEEEEEAHPQEVGILQKRFGMAQIVVFLLGLVIIALMVYATAA